MLAKQVDRFTAVARFVDDERLLPQRRDEHAAHVGLVVDHEDPSMMIHH